jgi:hypothetical protein
MEERNVEFAKPWHGLNEVKFLGFPKIHDIISGSGNGKLKIWIFPPSRKEYRDRDIEYRKLYLVKPRNINMLKFIESSI